MRKESRDARRWAAYERLAEDPSAAPNERAQARAHAEELGRRYPGGRPEVEPEPFRVPRGAARSGWRWASWEETAEADRQRRARAAPSAEEQRRTREAAVRLQRANVERVPRWEASATLRDLHANTEAWSEEEERRFKEQRVRLTGSSRASDL